MWTSSVAAFTALILVVHFNLYTRLPYMTWYHALAIFGLSIGPYLIYMWSSNYLPAEISNTQYAVLEAHRSPIFYLKIFCCVMASFIVDYAISSYQVLVRTSPSDFLR